MGEEVFRDPLAGNSLTARIHILHNWPLEVSCADYDRVNYETWPENKIHGNRPRGFVSPIWWKSPFFLTSSSFSQVEQVSRFWRVYASNDMVSPKKVSLGGHNESQFHWRSIFIPLKSRNPHWFGWESQNTERFQEYLHEGSTDKRKIYLKLRGQWPGRILLRKNVEENVLSYKNSQKIIQWGNPSQMSIYHYSAKS